MSGLMCAPLGHDRARTWRCTQPRYWRCRVPRPDAVLPAGAVGEAKPVGVLLRAFCKATSVLTYKTFAMNKRYKAVPFLVPPLLLSLHAPFLCLHTPQFHTTDVFNVYETGELTDYLVNFVTALDPNGPTVPTRPAYTTEQPNLMTFADGLGIGDGRETGTTAVTKDTFRDMSAEERLDHARRGLFRSVERPRTSSLRGYRSSRRPAACVDLYAYGVCKEKY
ncbi:hypothetical protein B0H14DRAFT_3712128 [Mycena olivaceomarginata]|nr:hypothetical protein B0H14DRAFT_3712128 [Mycena olivaceomarginata]